MKKTTLRRTSLILALVLLTCTILTGCENVQAERQRVTAAITEKNYVKEETKYGYYFDALKGKMRWKWKHFPAEYNVTIEYEGITKTYDRRSLYDSYEIGDEIEMELTTYYDEENNIITEGFYAPSISLPH